MVMNDLLQSIWKIKQLNACLNHLSCRLGAFQRYMCTPEYIPVDGNFEDVTTAILREIGQDSDSPDSDSGSEMELESKHVRARGHFILIKRISINICAHLI